MELKPTPNVLRRENFPALVASHAQRFIIDPAVVEWERTAREGPTPENRAFAREYLVLLAKFTKVTQRVIEKREAERRAEGR